MKKVKSLTLNGVDYDLTPEVIDNLDTADSNTSLSANQGKVLNEKIDNNNETINIHTQNINNPHKVTKEQIELGNVDNTSDTDKPVSIAQQQAIDTVQNNINEHTENTLNPHNVTAKQIGLENVNNTADINKPVSTAQQDAIDLAYHNSNLYTDEKIAELINGAPTTLDTLKELSDAITEHEEVVWILNDAIGKKANETEFNSHITNKINPHNVTKEQIGLGNCDNTSDRNKPISTATQSALDGINSNLFTNMGWEVLLKTNATTQTQFTVPNLTTFKFLSLELRFNSYIIAQIILPAVAYAEFRNVSGYVDTHSAVGQLICASATSINAWVVQQVNNTNIYVMLRGIKEK